MSSSGERKTDDFLSDAVNMTLFVESETVSPEAVSQFLGLPYDRCLRKGETRKVGKIDKIDKINLVNLWKIEVKRDTGSNDPLVAGDTIQACLKQVLARAQPYAPKFRELSRDHTVEIFVGVSAEQMPCLTFPKDSLQQVSDLGASLQLDLVIYGEEDA